MDRRWGMTIPWNVKTNQSCWNCAHFQRYDPLTENLTKQFGDCRRFAPKGYRVEDQGFSEGFSFVERGDLHWCSHWKKTNLTVPPLPENPIPVVWPEDYTNWPAWTKFDYEIKSCWNCNNFQAGKADPRDVDDTDGECRKKPNPPVTLLDTVANVDWLAVTSWELKGVLFWCGEWEKANHVVPDFVPENPQALRKPARRKKK